MDSNNTHIKVTPLGGGCEVGRSCILVEIQDKKILLDCGIHPSETSLASLPFFDSINPEQIDILLVTHFHLDHCGAVPYFIEKTSFKGKVFMTFPTKAICKQILLDSIRVGTEQLEKPIYNQQDLLSSMQKVIGINFHEEIKVDGIRFVAYNAGHVIGAAMFLIEINKVRVLYTGDYSWEKDIHIIPAEIPEVKVDMLIVESTYGTKTHEPREFREKFFLETVEKIVKRQGKCLLPVFVLGRAQELLLLLEEYWAKKPELQGIPIYYASTMMQKCMLIFQTYLNMMGVQIQEKMWQGINPFNFKYIHILRKLDTTDIIGQAMVVMASPGMLQSGLSRQLFQKWCHDDRNGVLFTGYCVESTLAKDILNGMREFYKENGQSTKVRMSVEYISFSAHADFDQTKDFIEKVKPKMVVLVHGEKHEAQRLKGKLDQYFEEGLKIEVPENWESVDLIVEQTRNVGLEEELANLSVNEKQWGLLISNGNDFEIKKIVSEEEFIKNEIFSLDQETFLEFIPSIETVYHILKEVVEDTVIDNGVIMVRRMLRIYKPNERQIILAWKSSQVADVIGDCIGYLLYQISHYPEFENNKDQIQQIYKEKQDKRVEFLMELMKDQYGEESVKRVDSKLTITSKEEIIAEIELDWNEVLQAKNELIKGRMQNMLNITSELNN